MVVQQEKSLETHGLESSCGPAEYLDRCFKLWMGLPFSVVSQRCRTLFRGLELAYQKEMIYDSLVITLSDRFEATSRGLVFDGQHYIRAVFNEQGSCHSLQLMEMEILFLP